MHFGQYDLTIASPGISERPEQESEEDKNQHFFKIVFELTKWKHRLTLAIDARTVSEISTLVFLDHLGNASIGQDVPGMDQTIEHLGCLFDEVGLVGIVVQLVF